MSILNFSKNSIIQAKTLKLMLKQKFSANSFGLFQAFISFSKCPRISGIFRLKLSKLVVGCYTSIPKKRSIKKPGQSTAFFSKVMEKFVVEWLLLYIGDKMDTRQFGGLKGNSISHYMIELINFILKIKNMF